MFHELVARANFDDTTDVPRIHVFVYGTLRPGGPNHDRYCRSVAAIEPATVCGRIEHLPAGYPMLHMSPDDVLARGSPDALADAALQDEWRARTLSAPGGATVEGELLGFDDPERRFARLDALEDFRAAGGGLYDRVLVRAVVKRTGGVVPAWVYVSPVVG